MSSPAHQVQRCANATSPRLFHGTDGGPRPHDVDSDDDQDDDEDEDEDDGDDVGVLSCHPCPVRYGGAASVLLERLTMPGTTRVSFLPLPCGTTTVLPYRDLASSPLLSYSLCHPLPSGGTTMLTDGSRPTYHRHPHVQNPASGVNVPEFPRVSLLNMHLLRAGGTGWEEAGGWGRVGRMVQRDSFYLSRCSRLECGMTVFAIT